MLDIDKHVMDRITDMEKAIVFMKTIQKKPQKRKRDSNPVIDVKSDTPES